MLVTSTPFRNVTPWTTLGTRRHGAGQNHRQDAEKDMSAVSEEERLRRARHSRGARLRLPADVSRRRKLGGYRARAVARDVLRIYAIADPVRPAGLACARDAVRLRDGGGRRLPADRDSELDRPAAGAGLSARHARGPLAARASCLPDFGRPSRVAGGPCRSGVSRLASSRLPPAKSSPGATGATCR